MGFEFPSCDISGAAVVAHLGFAFCFGDSFQGRRAVACILGGCYGALQSLGYTRGKNVFPGRVLSFMFLAEGGKNGEEPMRLLCGEWLPTCIKRKGGFLSLARRHHSLFFARRKRTQSHPDPPRNATPPALL